MDFKIFMNDEEIQTLVDADLREDRGLAIVTGIWRGLLPFKKLSEQTSPFELKGLNIYITKAWISNIQGGAIDPIIEIMGILQQK